MQLLHRSEYRRAGATKMDRITCNTTGMPSTGVKAFFGFLCLAILTSHTLTMWRWSEARGVYDDVCYLRQAHLFQRFGVVGLNTDATMDDDRYFVGRLKEIALPDPENLDRWPCHVRKPSGKVILQYPPGTGFLLAAFPQGFQVAPLYISASIVVCCVALLGIWMARTLSFVIGAGLFGALAVYGMINPAKASYSVAPTVALCSIIGLLTALWVNRACGSSWLIALIGLLLGAAVNLRLPNILLASGYGLFLGVAFLRSRTLASFLDSVGFVAGVALGIMPTLIAQAINAGSPLATTYGASDAVAPAFNIVVLGEYLRDPQSLLICLAAGWTLWLLRSGLRSAHQIAFLVAGNLMINLGFFLSHPIFTPYYMVPIAMLCLWTVSFAWLIQPRKSSESAAFQCTVP
ncbi:MULTISPECIES: hypothetical protein [unclassified Bradyrhizobium]|uniref:hypothetical protein n=1 Tax=unclassified Bradyrhizobium TaxID=2631580 RepID=UPI001E500976|nr:MULTISPECIES: hypothetical protein [unclassified Bradyrhizobium]